MRQLVGFAAVVMVLGAHSALPALSPLTPSLTAETQAVLLKQLADVQFPEVAQNSVVLALTAALGMEPATRRFSYDEPYPQLPKVQAESVQLTDSCAKAKVTAWFAAPVAGRPKIVLEGTYCLQGAARWNSTSQVVHVLSPGSQTVSAPAPVGTATMLADGTITRQLRAVAAAGDGRGPLGDAQLVYPRGHPQYQDVLTHLGGLVPGEHKPVPPWPEETSGTH